MRLKKYEAFVRTVELGSLTAAANQLGYTQSGISHMLSALEEELGFRLLVRSRGGIHLTPAGEQLLPKLRELLEKKRELDELSQHIAGQTTGIVRVGAFTSVAVNWLPGILKDFPCQGVDIRMFNGDYHDVELWLERGEIDVGFIAMPGPDGMDCVPLKEDPLMVILPMNHPLAAMDAIPVELAAREPIISLLQASSQDVHRALDTAGIKPDIRYATKDDYAIIAMVQAGLGISIMPELLLRNHSRDVAVRPLSPESSRTLALATSPDRPITPAANRFIRFAVDWIRKNG